MYLRAKRVQVCFSHGQQLSFSLFLLLLFLFLFYFLCNSLIHLFYFSLLMSFYFSVGNFTDSLKWCNCWQSVFGLPFARCLSAERDCSALPWKWLIGLVETSIWPGYFGDMQSSLKVIWFSTRWSAVCGAVGGGWGRGRTDGGDAPWQA